MRRTKFIALAISVIVMVAVAAIVVLRRAAPVPAAPTLTPLRTLVGCAPRLVAFGADAETVFGVCDPRIVRWEPPHFAMQPIDGPLVGLAPASDGSALALVSRDASVEILRRGEVDAPQQPLSSREFARTVREYECRLGTLHPRRPLLLIQFRPRPDGTAQWENDPAIAVIDLADDRVLGEFRHFRDAMFAGRTRTLLIGQGAVGMGSNSTCLVFDLDSSTTLYELDMSDAHRVVAGPRPSFRVVSCGVSGFAFTVAEARSGQRTAGETSISVCKWDVDAGTLLAEWAVEGDWDIEYAAADGAGRRLLLWAREVRGEHRAYALVFDSAADRIVGRVGGWKRGAVRDMRLSHDGTRLLVSVEGEGVHVFDLTAP